MNKLILILPNQKHKMKMSSHKFNFEGYLGFLIVLFDFCNLNALNVSENSNKMGYYKTTLHGIRKTSRDRPKSAPYLRLKKTRKPLFLQLETTKALKKLKIEKEKFRIFFRFF